MTTITTELEETKRDAKGRRKTPVAEREEMVAGYRASGLTMEQYARQEGIKRHTLAKWVLMHDRRERQGRTLEFAEVKMPVMGRWAYELTMPNGWVVRVADAASVAQLMNLGAGAARC
jgi:transposase-like protein